MASPESLVEALARGLVQALLAASPATVAQPPESGAAAVKSRAKRRRPRPAATPSRRPGTAAREVVIPADLPKPGFDPAGDAPLPGFEQVPPVRTLADVEAAMERFTRGDGPPPGFYNPDEDTAMKAPLS